MGGLLDICLILQLMTYCAAQGDTATSPAVTTSTPELAAPTRDTFDTINTTPGTLEFKILVSATNLNQTQKHRAQYRVVCTSGTESKNVTIPIGFDEKGEMEGLKDKEYTCYGQLELGEYKSEIGPEFNVTVCTLWTELEQVMSISTRLQVQSPHHIILDAHMPEVKHCTGLGTGFQLFVTSLATGEVVLGKSRTIDPKDLLAIEDTPPNLAVATRYLLNLRVYDGSRIIGTITKRFTTTNYRPPMLMASSIRYTQKPGVVHVNFPIWNADGGSGSIAPDQYYISYRVPNATQWSMEPGLVNGAYVKATIVVRHPGVEYEFKLETSVTVYGNTSYAPSIDIITIKTSPCKDPTPFSLTDTQFIGSQDAVILQVTYTNSDPSCYGATSYVVETTASGAKVSTNCTATTCRIRNMEAHREYSLSVMAYNTAGRSTRISTADGSGYKSLTTPMKTPGPPRNFTASTWSKDCVSLTWNSPASDGGAISSYIVRCDAITAYSRGILQTHSMTYTVDYNSLTYRACDLFHGSLYNCSLFAHNRAGNSTRVSQRVWTEPAKPQEPAQPKVIEKKATNTTITLFLPEANEQDLPASAYYVGLEVVSSTDEFYAVPADVKTLSVSHFSHHTPGTMRKYITAKLTSAGSEFVVGNGTNVGGYYNAPLTNGQMYKIYYGVRVTRGQMSQDTFTVLHSLVQAQKYVKRESDKGVIIAVVTVALVIALLCAVIFFFVRRKGHRMFNTRRNMTIDRDLLNNDGNHRSPASDARDDDATELNPILPPRSTPRLPMRSNFMLSQGSSSESSLGSNSSLGLNSRPPPLQNLRYQPPHNSRPSPLQNSRFPPLQNSRPPPLQNSRPPPLQNSRPPPLQNSRSPPLQNSRPRPLHNSRPIPVQSLNKYISSQQDIMSAQWEALPTGYLPETPIDAASDPENSGKNRYKDMRPYDHSRVMLTPLPGDKNSDFISASFIEGYDRLKQYIAAGGPMENTVYDFWRMIWQYRVTCIAMITKLTELNFESGQLRVKCAQYWPGERKTCCHGNLKITNTSVENWADFTMTTLSITKAGEAKPLTVYHFQFLSWPDHGVPKNSTPLLLFRRKVLSFSSLSLSPLVIHCSAGVGRTGTFIAIDYLLEQAQAEKQVDVFKVVQDLRCQRVAMVQTDAQYKYVYQAVAEALDSEDFHYTAPQFHANYQNLINQLVIEPQFLKLAEISPSVTDEAFDVPEGQLNKNQNYITPHSSHRVHIMTQIEGYESTYINAVFINSSRREKMFISTQMPLPHTVDDYLRLLYDHQVYAVVALESDMFSNKKFGVYLPRNSHASLETNLFTVTITKNTHCVAGIVMAEVTLTSKWKKENSSCSFKYFQADFWARHKALPDDKSAMVALVREVEKSWNVANDRGRICVQCRDSNERTSVFLAIWNTLERFKSEQEVDVYHVVELIRMVRPQAITNTVQYRFIYEALYRYLQEFDNYDNYK